MRFLVQKFVKNEYSALAFLVGISLLLYYPARQAGFVMDWFGWQYAYNKGGWSDIPRSFGYPGLQPVLHFFNYTWYRVFGISGWPWYLVFAGLHGVNGFLLYRLVLRVLQAEKYPDAFWPAFAAAVFFVVSPYQAEAVIWRVCFHYLWSLFLALWALHKALDYMETGRLRAALAVQGCLLAGLFSLEWSLVMPVLVLIFATTYAMTHRMAGFFGKKLGMLFGLSVFIWAGYFGLNKLILGKWVGHYGAEIHMKIDIPAMFATCLKYTLKYPLLLRNWEHARKESLFLAMDSRAAAGIAVLILAALGAYFMLKFRKISPLYRWGIAALASFYIALAPVSNLYFYYLQWSENDRYGYMASAFMCIALACLCFSLPGIFKKIAFYAFAALSIWVLLRHVQAWGDSDKTYRNLVANFRWYDKSEVIVLAVPDNYHGVYMCRIIGAESGFAEALELLGGKKYKGRMLDVAQYNMNAPNDGVKVETDSTGLLYRASFRQDGNWWWHAGQGAQDYETDRYRFVKREWDVETQLLSKPPGTVVIYPAGNYWEEAR